MADKEEVIEEGGGSEESSPNSLRDSLIESIEAVGEESTEESPSGDGALPDDKPSIFQKEPEAQKAGPVSEPEKDDKKEQVASDVPPPDDSNVPDNDSTGLDAKAVAKAPLDWPPKAREHWTKLPDDVKRQIHERERMISGTMAETKTARNVFEGIKGMAQAYAPIMAAEGVNDPMAAIDGMFKTVAQLRMGTPAQKAQKMAAMIQHYGIDINALDSALVGETPEVSPNAQFEQLLDQRMAPVNQFLQEMQNRQQHAQQQTVEQANQEVAAFQGEFLSDVRMDMADLIDMAGARGQKMSLQEAYDKAVLLRPEIQEILQKRAADEALVGKQTNLQGKMNASSSLSGKQGGQGGVEEPDTIRGQIEQAWGADSTGRI